jgi:hypothetical protein
VGSSLAGFVGGLFFGRFGWPGEVATVIVLVAVGAVVAAQLPRGRMEAEVAGAP